MLIQAVLRGCKWWKLPRKPREVLLEEQGQDWRKIDLVLDHRRAERSVLHFVCTLMSLLATMVIILVKHDEFMIHTMLAFKRGSRHYLIGRLLLTMVLASLWDVNMLVICL